MVGVSDLDDAQPAKWTAAANDAMTASRSCGDLAATARDEVAPVLNRYWVDDTGKAARRAFVRQAEEFDAASEAMRGLAKAYTTLARKIEAAQRQLHSALDYARRYDLTVDESGRVRRADSTSEDERTSDERIAHVGPLIAEALRKATAADTEAATTLRVINGLAWVDSVTLTRQALSHPDSPLAIALRLQGGRGDLHPINVGREQFAAVDRAAKETGVSRTLLLATLWQEQQGYQPYDPKLNGPVTFGGRLFNWAARETLVPDKSLGITHMKLDTARRVVESNREQFVNADGTHLGDLTDRQLTKHIEENPNETIRISAYYYSELREDPHGTSTDKQLFLLYAAETQQVRDDSEKHGDSTVERDHAIERRARNWDALQAPLEDAQAWDDLSAKEKQEGLDQLASQKPTGHSVELNPIYERGPSVSTGTGPEPAPGTPSPSPGPGPVPTPPGPQT